MGKSSKWYRRYEIPSSVVLIVKAICMDYYRRDREIRDKSISGAVLSKYVELNAAIDQALGSIDSGIRQEMLEDIRMGRGYDFSMASSVLAKNTYYQRKRKVIWEIAKGLFLI